MPNTTNVKEKGPPGPQRERNVGRSNAVFFVVVVFIFFKVVAERRRRRRRLSNDEEERLYR